MKKQIFIFGFLCTTFVCFACSARPETSDKQQNTTLQSDIFETLQENQNTFPGCPVVTEWEDFTPVTSDQTFQPDTDHNPALFCSAGFTRSENSLYCMCKDYLYSINNDMSSYSIPDYYYTTANQNNAPADSIGLTFYQNDFYYMDMSMLRLKKFSPNDGIPKMVSLICPMSKTEVSTTYGSPECFCNWMIHKGYLYYCYVYYAGNTPGTYYANGSNHIFRMALEENAKPECLMPVNCLGQTEAVTFTGSGSYVYINIPDTRKSSGYLYRYNIESGEMEQLQDIGNDAASYVIHDGTIYYTQCSEPEKIYCYNPATREQNLFLDTSTKTYTHTFRIKADEDYLYSYYESSEEKNQLQKMNGGMTVFDWSGKEIADIPFGEEIINHRGYMDEFCGTDEKHIYFLRKIYAASALENPFGTDRSVYAKFYAIDKSDLEDGSYELHFAEAQPINE